MQIELKNKVNKLKQIENKIYVFFMISLLKNLIFCSQSLPLFFSL